MKTLLSTTALVIALGLPALVSAQTATDTATTTQAGTDMPGFLSMRGEGDIFASELIGRAVYAPRSQTAATTGTDSATGTEGMANTDGMHSMTTMTEADLDMMDNIGEINEIVLSADGKVRALVIGVGGFLGLGEQDVAVTMDQVAFAADADDAAEMYVVVNTNADMLRTSPAYRRDMMTGTPATDGTMATDAVTDTNAGTGAMANDRTAFVAPKIARDGYNQVAVTDVSAEMLVGKSVYGVNDDSVGKIDDLLVDDTGAISNVIIDFGGFLGMGTSKVSVGYDELTILSDANQSDVRVYIDATKEQVQAQPQYKAVN